MIAIDDFKYNLPEHRIAKYPLAKRDNAQLLIYKEGNIKQDHFFNLSDYIDAHSTLVFNNTKVIPARLFFTKDTGALLEIFLLHPISPSELVLEAMQAAGSSVWACTIGNVKRWTANATLTLSFEGVTLQATLVNKEKGHVLFQWPTHLSFAKVISLTGNTPLPPYLNREATQEDKERYQTIYSQHDGAVAAPTAGLHFTDHVFEKLKTKSINSEFVTLHVSAGTFMPVKTANALEHTMHSEQIIVAADVIKSLIETQNQVIVVGTTSMRTLESLYWMGVRCIHSKTDYQQVTQHEPYLPEQHKKIKPKEALEALYNQLLKDDKELLIGETSIYIHPGYDFKVCDGLITNFHQPGSTLMLLVAAFVGNDWKKIYQHALDNNFRFLSFGDSSLLWKSKT
jgi:S-adenosylmethionine:tRNA ribosyltransferase-isomerase